MKKLALVMLIVCAGVVVAVRARAGWRWGPVTVSISSSGGYSYVSGNLSDVRASSDGNEYLGCSVSLDLTSTGGMSSGQYSCFAQSSTLTYAGCSGSDLTVAQYINSGLKGDSFLYFEANPEGYCSYIEIENFSAIAPKQP